MLLFCQQQEFAAVRQVLVALLHNELLHLEPLYAHMLLVCSLVDKGEYCVLEDILIGDVTP